MSRIGRIRGIVLAHERQFPILLGDAGGGRKLPSGWLPRRPGEVALADPPALRRIGHTLPFGFFASQQFTQFFIGHLIDFHKVTASSSPSAVDRPCLVSTNQAPRP